MVTSIELFKLNSTTVASFVVFPSVSSPSSLTSDTSNVFPGLLPVTVTVLLTLPVSVLKFVEEKKISAGHAKIIVGLDNAEFIANKIIEKKLSVRQTENFVKVFKKKRGSFTKLKDPNIQDLQDSISQKIGLNVIIKNNKRNKGNITLNYKDLSQLNRIIEILKKYY